MRHRRNCPLFGQDEEAKRAGIWVSYSGPLVRGAIEAAISITRGSGGLSITPTLAFIPTVPSNSAAFEALNINIYRVSTAAEMQAVLLSGRHELLRLYQEGKASPRDLDEDGNTVLHVSVFRSGDA